MKTNILSPPNHSYVHSFYIHPLNKFLYLNNFGKTFKTIYDPSEDESLVSAPLRGDSHVPNDT